MLTTNITLTMTTLPEVYAQHTRQNDRIISLLSAVLMRNLSDDFYPAIRDRFPSSFESRSHLVSPPVRNSKALAAVVFVMDEAQAWKESHNITDLLKSTVRKSEIYSVEVVLKGSLLHDSRQLDRVFRLLDTSTHIFLITSSGAYSGVLSYLSDQQSENTLPTSLRGVVAIFPEVVNDLGLDEVPSLCIVQQQDKATTPNASQINVVVPTLAFGIQGKERLWIARTVLKFINAVMVVVGVEDTTYDLRQRHTGGTEEEVSGERKLRQLKSRL